MKKWFYVCPGCGKRTECHIVRWSSVPRFISHKDRGGEHCKWSGFEIPKNPDKEEWGTTASEPVQPYSGHIRRKPDYGEVEPDIEKRVKQMTSRVSAQFFDI